MGDTEYQRRRRAREKLEKLETAAALADLASRIPTRKPDETTMYDLDRLAEREAKEYTDFKARAIKGGWEYSGEGTGTLYTMQKFTNYDDLISKMSYQEREAFLRWTSGWFMRGQQWGGFASMSSYDKEYTRIFDKYLDQATLDKGLTLHRAAGWELINDGKDAPWGLSIDKIQAMKGKYIEVDGSMSTGRASEGLRGMGGGAKPVEYIIKIPAGSTGAGMWVGDSRINGWGPRQREFMTNRDIMVQVGDSYYDSKKGLTVVTLYYVGRRSKHKYE